MVVLKNDTVVIAKTGGGKTLIYIMVALMSKKILVVFEPLLALIEDQQRAINDFKCGLKVKGLIAEDDSSQVLKAALENQINICQFYPLMHVCLLLLFCM